MTSKLKNFNRAKAWIERYTVPNAGICVTSKQQISYPEVSGYFIPTLLNWGMQDLAVQYAKWLCTIQKPDGSWYDADDHDPYVFDTGQILKGLLAISEIMPEVEANILKSCDWLLSRINEEGRMIAPSQSMCKFDDKFSSELIHIYCLPPLIEVAKKYDRPVYESEAKRVLNYYKTNSRDDILDFKILSHFYAYIIEGLVDMGETDLAKEAMAKVSLLQKRNGAISGYRHVKWVCSTGLFQFALIYYKLGDKEHGDRAFDYALKLQNKSGGWYGSYPSNLFLYLFIRFTKNHRSNYFRNTEISWAVKYFLDALQWKLIFDSDSSAPQFLRGIDEGDGRWELVKNAASKKDVRKILDAGCGTGRYLQNLLKTDTGGA